jgi:hypothetical protein
VNPPRATSAVLLAALLGAGAAFATPADPGEASRSILQAQRCQTELPLPAGPAVTTGAVRRPPPGNAPGLPILELSPAVGLVFIALAIGLGLALLMMWLLPRRFSTGGAATPEAGTERPPPARLLPDAEALAQQGRFAEAIHALLLRALSELGRRPGSAAASPSTTSREVVRHAGLPAEVKAALGPLVRAVEWMHFGRTPAGAEDYASCADQYRRFREAWQASR